MNIFSKEWFETILFALGFLFVIPALAVFICWLLGDIDKSETLIYILYGGAVIFMLGVAHGASRK